MDAIAAVINKSLGFDMVIFWENWQQYVQDLKVFAICIHSNLKQQFNYKKTTFVAFRTPL
jgi:hypothetical protein